MNTSDTLSQYKKQIVPILKKHRVPKAAFFGSLASGTFTDDSDIDILVLPPKDMSLLGFIGLKQDIEDAVGKDIDLVSYNGMSPYFKESILANEQIFYETAV